MPIYEYRCEDCGTAFEKLVKASEVNGQVCPSCGTAHVKQQFSTFAAHSGGSSEPMMGGCPSGMCQTPGLCGRN